LGLVGKNPWVGKSKKKQHGRESKRRTKTKKTDGRGPPPVPEREDHRSSEGGKRFKEGQSALLRASRYTQRASCDSNGTLQGN